LQNGFWGLITQIDEVISQIRLDEKQSAESIENLRNHTSKAFLQNFSYKIDSTD